MTELVQHIINGLSLGGTYALLALGLAMVFSIMRLINFAHGELLTITGYGMVLGLSIGLPFLGAAVLGVCLAVIAALAMERVLRPLRGASVATLLLASFAISLVLQILFQNLISARSKSVVVPSFLNDTVSISGLSVGVIQVIAIAVTAVALVVLSQFLRKSIFGLAMRAAAVDFPTTRLMGIRANIVVATAFGLSGLLAGIAAVLYVSQRGSVNPTMGLAPVITAFVATVIGGLGSIRGAVVGGFALGFGDVALQAALPESVQPYRQALLFGLVILVVLFRPDGLLPAEGQSQASSGASPWKRWLPARREQGSATSA